MSVPNFSLEDGDFNGLFLTQKPCQEQSFVSLEKPQYSDISDDDLMDLKVPSSQVQR